MRHVLAQFEVGGSEPVPQGSKRIFQPKGGKPVLVEANVKTRPWRKIVSRAAARAVESEGFSSPLDGALELVVMFRFEMPKTRTGIGRIRGWGWRCGPPDLDKLIRPIGDACKDAGLIRDDSRICRIVAEKREVTSGSLGCSVEFRRLPS